MPALKNLKLKICGLRDNIEDVTALSPDYAGFIFYPPSPRYVGDDFSAYRLESVPASVARVGVFVNQPVDQVTDLVKEFGLDYAQLHGDESVDYCRRLKGTGAGVIKAFAGNSELDKAELAAYGPYVDFYLFDTRLQQYGGSGVSFDWTRLHNLGLEKPIFLSGGLDLTNVERLEQLDALKIHAIDVNSRFEVSPGLKDLTLIKKLKEKMERV